MRPQRVYQDIVPLHGAHIGSPISPSQDLLSQVLRNALPLYSAVPQGQPCFLFLWNAPGSCPFSRLLSAAHGDSFPASPDVLHDDMDVDPPAFLHDEPMDVDPPAILSLTCARQPMDVDAHPPFDSCLPRAHGKHSDYPLRSPSYSSSHFGGSDPLPCDNVPSQTVEQIRNAELVVPSNCENYCEPNQNRQASSHQPRSRVARKRFRKPTSEPRSCDIHYKETITDSVFKDFWTHNPSLPSARTVTSRTELKNLESCNLSEEPIPISVDDIQTHIPRKSSKNLMSRNAFQGILRP